MKTVVFSHELAYVDGGASAIKDTHNLITIRYPMAMHQQPPLVNFSPTTFAVTDKASSETLSLFMHPYLKGQSIKNIPEVITDTLQQESMFK